MATLKCPICKKVVPDRTGNAAYPFCSGRCKMVDLGNWFGGSYVASRPIDPEQDAEAIAAALQKQSEEEIQ